MKTAAVIAVAALSTGALGATEPRAVKARPRRAEPSCLEKPASSGDRVDASIVQGRNVSRSSLEGFAYVAVPKVKGERLLCRPSPDVRRQGRHHAAPAGELPRFLQHDRVGTGASAL
jgi:hypothetical protein